MSAGNQGATKYRKNERKQDHTRKNGNVQIQINNQEGTARI